MHLFVLWLLIGKEAVEGSSCCCCFTFGGSFNCFTEEVFAHLFMRYETNTCRRRRLGGFGYDFSCR